MSSGADAEPDAELAQAREARSPSSPSSPSRQKGAMTAPMSPAMRNFAIIAAIVLGSIVVFSIVRMQTMTGEGSTDSDPNAAIERAIEISDKPQSDARVYLTTKLSNGIEALAVEDPRTKQAAFAVAVEVGSFDDPEDFPGLTHFLEHMLFLGTKKYPDPDSFDGFISRNGGGQNAYTADEVTVFYAGMDASVASEGMDRFADFFRAPLFNEDLVDREVNAVASEHRKNTQDPARRVYAVMTSLADPASPVGRFHTGDVETLKTGPEHQGKNALTALRTHFARHYCTSRMRVVVIGPKSAKDQLRDAESAFGLVPHEGALASEKMPTCSPTPPSHAEPQPWPSTRLGKWVDVEGTSPHSTLEVSFSLPDLRKEYAQQPLDYIVHIIGYRGRGSLFYVLREVLGLAFSIRAGGDDSSAGTELSVSVSLTEEGRKKPQAVLDVLFAYLAHLSQSGVDKALLESLAAASDVDWQWQEPTEAIKTVEDLAERLTRMPAKDVLWGDEVARQPRPDRAEELLKLLVPTNARVAFVDPSKLGEDRSPGVSAVDSKSIQTLEHWNVRYAVRNLTDVYREASETWAQWTQADGAKGRIAADLQKLLSKSGFAADKANAFPEIPKPLQGVPKVADIKLTNAEAAVDSSVSDSVYGSHPERLALKDLALPAVGPSADLWYRKGWRSNAPKFSPYLSLKVLLRSFSKPDTPERTAADTVRMAMYQSLLAEELDVALADLLQVGGGFSVSPDLDALGFAFGGLPTELANMASQVLETFSTAMKLPTANVRFDRVRATLDQSLRAYTEMPISYAIVDRNLLLTKGDHSKEDLAAELAKLQAGSVASAVEDLVFDRPLQATSMAMGNIPKDEATGTVATVLKAVSTLNGPAKELEAGMKLEAVTPVVELNGVAELRKLNPRPGDKNDVAVVSVVVGVASVESRVLFSLLGRILGRVAFSVLRTKMQLGYVANGGDVKISNVLLLSAVVQGDTKGADEMEAAIEHVFHKDVPEELAKLTPEDLASHIESFAASLEQPPVHTADEVSHFWGPALLDNTDCFNLHSEMLTFAKRGVTKELLTSEWARVMSPQGGRNKLVVKYFASKEALDKRPSADEVQTMLQGLGLQDDAVLRQLRAEHERAAVLTEANAAARATLLEHHSSSRRWFPTDIVCKAKPGASALLALSGPNSTLAMHRPRVGGRRPLGQPKMSVARQQAKLAPEE